MAEVQHVEEAKLCEGSRLNLFHTVVVQMQLLQGGEPIEGFLRSQHIAGEDTKTRELYVYLAAVCLASQFWSLSSHLVQDVNFVVGQI